MHINQGGAIINSIPTYYIRLKIVNNGKKTLENVEVVVENVEPKPDKFMSLNLSWAGFIVPIPNDIQRATRLPQKQARIVDFIEVMKPESTRELASRLSGAQDTDAERYGRYAEGFRICTIKPNTLSDIYPQVSISSIWVSMLIMLSLNLLEYPYFMTRIGRMILKKCVQDI